MWPTKVLRPGELGMRNRHESGHACGDGSLGEENLLEESSVDLSS